MKKGLSLAALAAFVLALVASTATVSRINLEPQFAHRLEPVGLLERETELLNQNLLGVKPVKWLYA